MTGRQNLKWIGVSAMVLAFATPALAEKIELTQGWAFRAGTVDGAQAVGFDDSQWQRVSVPHDFSIQDTPDGTPPFNKDAVPGSDSGYLSGGEGWYRRDIDFDPKTAADIVYLTFEAVYMDADIWLNGVHIAKHHYGYTAFTLDLTGKVKAGKNVIAVRVNHVDPSSRWYAGSGIIRPVHLESLDRIHIDPQGLVVTIPVATADKGVVAVKTPVKNTSAKAATVVLTSVLRDAAGRRVGESRLSQALKPGAAHSFDQTLSINRPALWSIETPNLYRLEQAVQVGDKLVDARATRVGIRTITVDAQNGFLLNGQPVELKGGNIHHDNYMLGAEGWVDADKRKVALMKAAGYNAIRNAHNPASQATLDAADELGVLVVNEAFDAWNYAKKDKDYARFFKADWKQDIDSLVITGRNHPSVIFWSIGNEIPEQGSAEGVATARMLATRVRELDPTRPVTQGVNLDSPANASLFAELDVAGYNYRAHFFAKDHVDHPKRVMFTTESTSKDAFKYWRIVEDMPSVIGDFVWTSVDYIGEAGIGWMGYSKGWKDLGPYPWHLAYSGEIDVTGRKRPAAYYREVFWKTGRTPISAFVRQPAGTEDLPDRELFKDKASLDWSLEDLHESWTWKGQDGKPLEVVVYSEFPEVELLLNGRSLGKKAVSVDSAYKADFNVPYAPGTLTAVGYRDGRAAGQWQLRTAGQPASARVTLDRTQIAGNGKDLVYATIELLDRDGVPVYAQADDRKVVIEVTGAGTLAGAGSGNPQRIESLKSGRVTTFHGRAQAVIQAGDRAGSVIVTVTVNGLPTQRLIVPVVAP
ncbi:glycoside hydrolase family 2 TIM barrel-domain containing protein [Asticcacaulis machinosus]|uniref:Glycoside hydrolase family 2 TIM barrel-domain containing protein n=1 Tax=Asticcacaulis machinosus TaxID=2984211 RepID=A0ABT5HIU0_9CAUL|nr:glycoside hydrolase family 2 TIM barrel-domain containing protein [Asticcacaulis machinosus]MDC7676155.1 glycoside hydrolase family 2 TIM barrel-domain containing protein [Asticcacaulis machinosus]